MGGMASTLAIVSLAEAIQIAQNKHAINRDEIWAKREYGMALQSMRINVLNTIREEMRDQLSRIIASLDNIMLVATFMLSFGFGFVVEGTFPPSQSDYGGSNGLQGDDVQTLLLHVYIVLCALVLICPFFSMMLALLIRQEVDDLQSDVMGNLQKHLSRTLRSSLLAAPGSLHQTDPHAGGRRRGHRQVFGEAIGLRPSGSFRDAAVSIGKSALGTALGTLMTTESSGFFSEGELDMLKRELLVKVSTYHRFYPLAQIFLWSGIFFGLLLCAVLMGLTYHHNNQDVPWLSIGYSVSVSLCAFGSVVFLGCYGYILFRTRLDREDERDEEPWRMVSARSFASR